MADYEVGARFVLVPSSCPVHGEHTGQMPADHSASWLWSPQEEAAQQQPCSVVTDVPRAYLRGPLALRALSDLGKSGFHRCAWSCPEGGEHPSDRASATCFSRCGVQTTHWGCVTCFFRDAQETLWLLFFFFYGRIACTSKLDTVVIVA